METNSNTILIRDYDYPLPPERIASFPLKERDRSKLLLYKEGSISDHHFSDLDTHLPANSLIVLNDTRVIEARLNFQKQTGGVIEIFCLGPHEASVEEALQKKSNVQWECLIGGASKWKPGQLLEKKVYIHNREIVIRAKYVERLSDSFVIEFSWHPDEFVFSDILHAAGAIPLPPYIKREAHPDDKLRYQTVFNRYEGSVAAPTAALHFTEEVFRKLEAKNISSTFITLHVGAGTFKPVKTENIADHQMHREPFTASRDSIEKIIAAKNLIAAGTTSLRTMESLYWIGIKLLNKIENPFVLDQWEAYELGKSFGHISVQQSLKSIIDYLDQEVRQLIHCHTSLIIVPGYEFRLPSALITNFHQPQSTLLLLVSAFIGEDWKKIYRHALDNDYRFLSYGDSSLLWRNANLS